MRKREHEEAGSSPPRKKRKKNPGRSKRRKKRKIRSDENLPEQQPDDDMSVGGEDEKEAEVDLSVDEQSSAEYPLQTDPPLSSILPEGLSPIAAEYFISARQNPRKLYIKIDATHHKTEKQMFEMNVAIMVLTHTMRQDFFKDKKSTKEESLWFTLRPDSDFPKNPYFWFRIVNKLPTWHPDTRAIFDFCQSKIAVLPHLVTSVIKEGEDVYGVGRKAFLSKLKERHHKSSSNSYYMDSNRAQAHRPQKAPKPTESGIRYPHDDPAYMHPKPKAGEKFHISGLGKRTLHGHQQFLKELKNCVEVYNWKPDGVDPNDTRSYMPPQNPSSDDPYWRQGPPPANITNFADSSMKRMISNFQCHFNPRWRSLLFENNVDVKTFFCAYHAGIHEHSGYGWWAVLSDNSLYHACVTCPHITLSNFDWA